MSNVTSMFSADSAVYHGIGNVVKGARSSAEAIKLAGLDWTADKRLIYTSDGIQIPDYYAITRSDNNEVLGISTKKYVPIQNSEAFAFTDSLLGNGVTYETAWYPCLMVVQTSQARHRSLSWLTHKPINRITYKGGGRKPTSYFYTLYLFTSFIYIRHQSMYFYTHNTV